MTFLSYLLIAAIELGLLCSPLLARLSLSPRFLHPPVHQYLALTNDLPRQIEPRRHCSLLIARTPREYLAPLAAWWLLVPYLFGL
jgi:hypothetical protein